MSVPERTRNFRDRQLENRGGGGGSSGGTGEPSGVLGGSSTEEKIKFLGKVRDTQCCRKVMLGSFTPSRESLLNRVSHNNSVQFSRQIPNKGRIMRQAPRNSRREEKPSHPKVRNEKDRLVQTRYPLWGPTATECDQERQIRSVKHRQGNGLYRHCSFVRAQKKRKFVERSKLATQCRGIYQGRREHRNMHKAVIYNKTGMPTEGVDRQERQGCEKEE